MKNKKQKKAKKVVKSLEEIPEILKETKEIVSDELPPENPIVESGDIEPLETPPEEPKEEPITNLNNCEYRLTLNFNNEKFECYTNNLKISMLSFGKEPVTDGFIKIEKGQAVWEKKLSLVQLRQLFKDEQTLDIMLNTFYSLYGQPSNIQAKLK